MMILETVRQIIELKTTKSREELNETFDEFKTKFPKLFDYCVNCETFDFDLLNTMLKRKDDDNVLERDMDISMELSKRFLSVFPDKEMFEKGKEELRRRCR
jgi:Asp-tRNA(Asn)/Glu-tRNA(Gln) amidotransferase C subunit